MQNVFGRMWVTLGEFRQGGGLSKEDFEDLAENLARAWAKDVQHAMLCHKGRAADIYLRP